MSRDLHDVDEGWHVPGGQLNWNESRYVDFWDGRQRLGGWLRIGMRPNARYAEMSVCGYLPGGQIAYFFSKSPIAENGLSAGGQTWEVIDPYVKSRVRYSGEVMVLADGWSLTNPGPAFRTSPRETCEMNLTVTSCGSTAVMGSDQAHVDRILLPGQADFHYQQLAHTSGTVTIGGRTWTVSGVGGKDHSWGPRNWHAKSYLRWLTAVFGNGDGFMLMRAVGPTKQTRGGHAWVDGTFHLVDDFAMRNVYAGAPHHQLRSVEVSFETGRRSWSATGRPQTWLPLRHKQTDDVGHEALLRIVKSPTVWMSGDGRTGGGACEFHDLVVAGTPVGLHD